MLNRELVEILKSMAFSEGLVVRKSVYSDRYDLDNNTIWIKSVQYLPYVLAHELGHYLYEFFLKGKQAQKIELSYCLNKTEYDNKRLRQVRITTEKKAWDQAAHILKIIDPQFNEEKFKRYSTKCILTYSGIY